MHDLHELVTLSALEREEIKRADAYYAGKVFEYPQMFEAVRAYPNDPEISHLMTSAEKLVAGLYRPCLEAAGCCSQDIVCPLLANRPGFRIDGERQEEQAAALGSRISIVSSANPHCPSVITRYTPCPSRGL